MYHYIGQQHAEDACPGRRRGARSAFGHRPGVLGAAAGRQHERRQVGTAVAVGARRTRVADGGSRTGTSVAGSGCGVAVGVAPTARPTTAAASAVRPPTSRPSRPPAASCSSESRGGPAPRRGRDRAGGTSRSWPARAARPRQPAGRSGRARRRSA